ncbi:unnamed protein product [Vitrella brassicaformis CCMP3155]|uniref:Uncharacterized protein n=1 Tax=Vitrella brassicaformis (strain CCMP3155) TaxID=1169540 RepID=A0A0G4EMZ2_VITBC|nr:unnamed protein product [Vitrella brassicaformis CCMP3155]|eukprot:CEL98185.1 unnamed protein product [Vitrella brassicaformis CCMP3155]
MPVAKCCVISSFHHRRLYNMLAEGTSNYGVNSDQCGCGLSTVGQPAAQVTVQTGCLSRLSVLGICCVGIVWIHTHPTSVRLCGWQTVGHALRIRSISTRAFTSSFPCVSQRHYTSLPRHTSSRHLRTVFAWLGYPLILRNIAYVLCHLKCVRDCVVWLPESKTGRAPVVVVLGRVVFLNIDKRVYNNQRADIEKREYNNQRTRRAAADEKTEFFLIDAEREDDIGNKSTGTNTPGTYEAPTNPQHKGA